MEYKLRVGCAFCGKEIPDGDYYMVHDHIWKLTGLPKSDKNKYIELHNKCLETMIGRELTEKDFKEVPINYMNGFLKL